MTTCIIVDVQFIARDGLKAHFRTSHSVEVIGTAACAAEALEIIERLRPDLAIVDLVVPGADAVGLLTDLREHGCPVPVIVYSTSADAYLVERVMDAGASGYVVKDSNAALLDRAITRVLDGHRFIDPEIAMAMLDGADDLLTPREHEVLELASHGLPNKSIAFEMRLGVETIRTHMASVIGKLHAVNRTGAVAKALRMTLID
ncbi:MAG: two component transcriptional regulator, LuxR family [Thermoleophilia bacterium]|nr:two component transcriptional regulator, LuxR family [Thermoleophilia bacterium]